MGGGAAAGSGGGFAVGGLHPPAAGCAGAEGHPTPRHRQFRQRGGSGPEAAGAGSGAGAGGGHPAPVERHGGGPAASRLPRLQQTAAEEIAAQGSRYTVSAWLEETEFPTREYDGFALPSGEYLALRVVIGEGAGKNWWCVVFPPLCTTAACDFQETAVSGGLGEEDLSLITEEDGGYVLRFRAVELWEGLRQWLGKH